MYNGAVNGGVFYCNMCTMNLTNLIIDHNEAQMGGVIYFKNYVGDLYSSNITIQYAKAYS
jgi:hypothetical protein